MTCAKTKIIEFISYASQILMTNVIVLFSFKFKDQTKFLWELLLKYLNINPVNSAILS